MRTELTYAADAMARYNGDYEYAHGMVSAYHSQGGLSDAYYTNVVNFMYDIHQINTGSMEFVTVKLRRRIIKAMRRKMPRVHTEVSNWRLTYNCAMLDTSEARIKGRLITARACIREARHIRQIYL